MSSGPISIIFYLSFFMLFMSFVVAFGYKSGIAFENYRNNLWTYILPSSRKDL